MTGLEWIFFVAWCASVVSTVALAVDALLSDARSQPRVELPKAQARRRK